MGRARPLRRGTRARPLAGRVPGRQPDPHGERPRAPHPRSRRARTEYRRARRPAGGDARTARTDRDARQLDDLGCDRPARDRASRRGRASAISSGPSARAEAGRGIRKAAPDSNDTAAAIQALRAAGRCSSLAGDPPGALRYLRSLQRPDGGFALGPGRAADAQSTAWAIQAFVAAGQAPPPRAFRYLAQLRQADGSYRYSKRYAATPVWVTSQVLPGARPETVPASLGSAAWRAGSPLRSSRSATSSSPGTPSTRTRRGSRSSSRSSA